MDGCYAFSSLGHKLKVCGTKKRHYTISIKYCLMDGCYAFSSLGHKLKVCGTKKRHYILIVSWTVAMVLVL